MTRNTLDSPPLRSARWWAPDTMRGFAHRQRLQQVGYRRKDFMDKPAIAIVNTWSSLATCHSHLRERAASIAEAIAAAGGMPLEFFVAPLPEVMVKPTTMMYRNLLAMETEELLRSQPIDGAVLLGGCDKTTPGLVMGALSATIPFLFVPAGATLNGRWCGRPVGSGTHTRRLWDERSVGALSDEQWSDLESALTRSAGTCNTMGTASTMTIMVEAMGLSLPGAASIPAVDSAHIRMCKEAGERIVGMVREDLRPGDFLDNDSFDNAAIVHAALGGSTNAVIHLAAIAGRCGATISASDFDRRSREVPVIVDTLPTGTRLMEDFHYAGGTLGLFSRLRGVLHGGAMTVNGRTLADNFGDAPVWDDSMIRTLDNPISTAGAIAHLRGNLCPDGAIIRPCTASTHLMSHRGRAVVFDNIADMYARIDDPSLEITASDVLVLRNGGPVGGPGMPEWGALPLPKAILAQGVNDMVRISDARMSGTHFGTCVLHVSPESAVGGPLALLQNGDVVVLDVAARTLDVLLDDAELERRRAQLQPAPSRFSRGYAQLYCAHVTSASQGCDFDFLIGTSPTPEPAIY